MGTLIGLFDTRGQAQRAAAALRQAGFSPNDISVVMSHREDAAEVAAGAGLGEVSAAGAGAVGGTVLGGAAGLALGFGLLTIPGLGPLLAAGPIVAAITGAGVGAAAGGLLGALSDLGVSEQDAPHYQEGVERGGVLVTVKAPDGRESEAHAILEREGLRHLDEHRKLWKSNPGYRYHTGADTEVGSGTAAGRTSSPATPRNSTMATKKTTEHEGVDRATVDAKAGGTAAGGTAGALIGAAVGGPVGAGVGAVAGAVIGGAAGAAVDDRDYTAVEPEFRQEWERGPYKASSSWDDASTAYRHGWESHTRPEHKGRSWDEVKPHVEKNWAGKAPFKDYEPLARSGWEKRAACKVESGGQAVVPVVEEQVSVGKREVSKGGVRVETRVTEKPVQAQVNLHEEHVNVERRPVNRAVAGADAAAFKEGTIEVAETAEEAVVTKTARVVEEVVINKTGHDRTETVHDTVRKTDVDVKKVDTPITGQACDVDDTTTKGRGKKA